MMFCNKTNADGVSLHQFPADESVRRQWLHLFDGHHLRVIFAATIFQLTDEGFGAKNAGFSSKLVLKKSTVPSIHGSPTPEQVNEARRMKTKLPLCNEQSRVEDSSSVVTQETYTETLFLDTIVYKDTRFKDQTILDVWKRVKMMIYGYQSIIICSQTFCVVGVLRGHFFFHFSSSTNALNVSFPNRSWW